MFAAALVEAGMSTAEWAEKVGGVSDTQVYRVLKDPTNSAPLTAKIDDFIEQHTGTRVATEAP